MHTSQLLNLLNQYHPGDQQEITYKQRIITFIQQHTNCFERSLACGHITASCMLLNKDMSKALLMHHNKLDMWVQLGGHCDGNSDVLAVAIQEAQEESGINDIAPVSTDIFDVDIHVLPEHSKESGTLHYDIRFLLKVTSDADFVQNSESKELKWFGKEDKLPTTERSVIRLFEKWKNL